MLDIPSFVDASATAHFSDIIASLNRANTLHAVVRALVGRHAQSILSFERCGLILASHAAGAPESRLKVIWSTPDSEETSQEVLDSQTTPLVAFSGVAAPSVLDETTLATMPLKMFEQMRSALVLPLSTGGVWLRCALFRDRRG